MKPLPLDKALLRRRILRSNIAIGILIFIIAIVLTLTGQYADLAERQAAESLYNYMALGGLLYSAVAWIICAMSKPFWFPMPENTESR